MTSYAPDSTASAVVLCKQTHASYEYIGNDFRLATSHEVKIKILRPDGTSYANVTIPYYEREEAGSGKEAVSQIEATSYNLENGQVVKTRMKKEFIFKERMNSKYMQVKFSIPNVKVGTVIEYKYKTISDFYYSLDSWEAQESIPVLYGMYNVMIPEYFRFNLEMRGTERLESKETPESTSFTVTDRTGSAIIRCACRSLTFKAHQLPALRADNYIWCADDYRSRVNFELKGLDFPGAMYKSFTQTWEEIDEMLLKDSEFGEQLKTRHPYQEEVAALQLDKLPDTQAKVTALYSFLKKKVSWNEQYNLYGNVKKAVKTGTGSNADINFLLISMLRDSGISAYPVVMSLRSRGVFPFSYPSIQKINTFVVAIAHTDSTYLFLDGSVRHGAIDILPPVLMVNRARLVNEKSSQWVDLSTLGKNHLRSMVSATIDADGKISGTRTASYQGQYASNLRSRFKAAKDSAEFVGKVESEENIQVSNLAIKELHTLSPQVTETLTFEKQSTVNDNLIYLNPLVFTHISKPIFTQEERKLPIELPFPDQVTLTVSLTLPQGYAVEELPKPLIVFIENDQGKCMYNIKQQDNKLTLLYRFQLSKLLFLPSEYTQLKAFWESIVNMNNEMIVLKKL